MALRANKRREGIKHAIIWFVLLTSFFPLYLMVVISLKDNVQFTNNPWWFDAPATWHWENWAKGWLCAREGVAEHLFGRPPWHGENLEMNVTKTREKIADHKEGARDRRLRSPSGWFQMGC